MLKCVATIFDFRRAVLLWLPMFRIDYWLIGPLSAVFPERGKFPFFAGKNGKNLSRREKRENFSKRGNF